MAAAASEDKIERSGGGGKLPLILAVVNTLATLAMIGILLVSFQREKKSSSIEDLAAHSGAAEGQENSEEKSGEKGAEGGKEGAPKKAAEFGKMVTLEQFTVNLSTPGSVTPKFVRVNISLEVPNDDSETEVNTKMPQVRNAIIDLFNSKRTSDLASPDGRDYLKEEIRNALNGFLVNGKVKGVYFTNFAVSG
ncbi:MAG: flagellar basal body-associated FliL family protein [Oligoflexia bacterium]|nr:flagellar basal body-associated FliL family protein [Oligoflexia bacterium]